MTTDHRGKKDLAEKLAERSEAGPDGCILWTGAKTDRGYGVLKSQQRTIRVHRLAYELANGAIAPEQQIDHSCRIRTCINPEHLRLATNKQNRENLATTSPNSSSGLRGVFWDKRERKWRAKVKHDGTTVLDKHFRELEDAKSAVTAKRNELYTHNDDDRKAR